MKKSVGVFLIGLFLVSFTFALGTEVTIMSKPNSFTGAYLKWKSLESASYGTEKTYPSNYDYTDVGVVKFDVESGLTEAMVQVVLMNQGAKILENESGPYDLTKGSLTIDLRKKVELNVTKVLVVEEIFNETNESVVEEVIEEVVEPSEGGWKGWSFFRGWLTGFSVSEVKEKFSGSNQVYYLGGVGIFMAVLLFFLVVRRAYQSGAKAELRTLARMQLDEKIDALD